MIESTPHSLLHNMSVRPNARVHLRGAKVGVAWRVEVPNHALRDDTCCDGGGMAGPLAPALVAELFDLAAEHWGSEIAMADIGVTTDAFVELPAIAPARRAPFTGEARTLQCPRLALAILGRVRGRVFLKGSQWRLNARDLAQPTVVYLPMEWTE